MDKQVHVLFVCLGNICRSPMAQGVFADMVAKAGLGAQIKIDSAGTHAFGVGRPPDGRAQRAIAKRNVDIGDLCARPIEMSDFKTFDYIIAMDRSNMQMLRYTCPSEQHHVLRLFLEFSPDVRQADIPDPYEADEEAFESVLDLVEGASAGLLDEIRERHL